MKTFFYIFAQFLKQFFHNCNTKYVTENFVCKEVVVVIRCRGILPVAALEPEFAANVYVTGLR